MRLLLVNWQDRQNPQAGGAETHLHEIFGRLAQRGHDVTLLCGGWPDAPPRADLDGISVHRVGTRYTFPFLARRYFDRYLRVRSHDVLMEDINKVPLFTTRWGARRVVVVVPHLFGETAFAELPAPAAAAVWLAERPLPRAYAGVPFEAISESTASDLAERGIPRSRIRVIYCGAPTETYTPDPRARAAEPLFVYVGRLRKYKGVDLVIRAFARMAHPSASLEIAGTGDDRPRLEALVRSLDLSSRVRFLGFISEEEKIALLRRAWAVVFASVKEGWGISNLEAAACGTPAVASNSPGLRESVRDEETGFLVPHGDIDAMAASLDRLAVSPDLVERLGRAGRAFALGFSWDRAANETEAHLLEVMRSGPEREWK